MNLFELYKNVCDSYEKFKSSFEELQELDFYEDYQRIVEYDVYNISRFLRTYEDNVDELIKSIGNFIKNSFLEEIEDVILQKRDGLEYLIEIVWKNKDWDWSELCFYQNYFHNGDYFKLFDPESDEEFKKFILNYCSSLIERNKED